ncbi:hypothetical protein [uncultured Psychromonas sp.]|nr:hypothetical protein [uncultured Psychromonas sp.]
MKKNFHHINKMDESTKSLLLLILFNDGIHNRSDAFSESNVLYRLT